MFKAAKIILYSPQHHFTETTFQGFINTQNFWSQLLWLTEPFHVLLTQVVPNLGLDRFQGVRAFDKKW